MHDPLSPFQAEGVASLDHYPIGMPCVMSIAFGAISKNQAASSKPIVTTPKIHEVTSGRDDQVNLT